MRIAKAVVQKKEKFAIRYWTKHNKNGNAKKLDTTIRKKFGTGLGLAKVYDLRKQARGQTTGKEAIKVVPLLKAARGPYKKTAGMEAVCTHCGKKAEGKKEVKEKFGFRNVNGIDKPQAWCRNCRSEASSSQNRIQVKQMVAARRVTKKYVKTAEEDETPQVVLVAAQVLLDEMRKNSVVSAFLTAKGDVKFHMVRDSEIELSLGERRLSEANGSESFTH